MNRTDEQNKDEIKKHDLDTAKGKD